MLSAKAQLIYEYIRDCILNHNFSPTVREICERVGIKSTSTVHYYLKELVDEGKIGEILSFEARYLHSGSIDPNRPIGWKQQMQGGVLLDLGSHALDLLTRVERIPQPEGKEKGYQEIAPVAFLGFFSVR